jgi:tetratricopeptide (TPR) repeat protein
MKGLDAQARQAFLRALELDPNNAGAMANLSIQELNHGRLDEAAYWGRRGFLLSGKRGNDFYHLVIPILNLRADRETRILLEEGERRSPTFSRVQMMLATLDLFEGRTEAALSRADALAASQPQNEEVKFFRADLAFLLDAPDLERWVTPLMEHGASNNLWVAETPRIRYAYALARRGDAARSAALVDEAERVARQKIDAGSETPALRVEMAAVAALRKDTDGALAWLERAVDAGYRDYDFIDRDPIFRAQLGADTRLAALVERMRRDVDAQRERARQRGLLELESLLGPAKGDLPAKTGRIGSSSDDVV